MSQPVFTDPAMVVRLGAELRAWAGTPFFPRMATRRVGVDCVRFAASVLHGINVVGAIEWPRYSIRGGGPELCAIIEQKLIGTGSLQCVWRRGDEPLAGMAGDVIFADNPIHFALRGPELEIWQCWHRSGVTTASFSPDALARVHSIWRAFA